MKKYPQHSERETSQSAKELIEDLRHVCYPAEADSMGQASLKYGLSLRYVRSINSAINDSASLNSRCPFRMN